MAEKGLGKGLGAGLGALFGEEKPQVDGQSVLMLPISKVEPRADQPRHVFDDVALSELAESLQKHGMIQPITARRLDSGYYQIIAGERRWRAARLAGFKTVPVCVVEADDSRAMELALVENLQREDLNPIEEAMGFRTLMSEYGMTQEQAAAAVGKSRPAVANALRLLTLTPEVLALVQDGKLSAGHARALLQLREGQHQLSAAKKVIEQELSVRQTENLAARLVRELQTPEPVISREIRVNYVEEVERRLTSAVGRKVKIVDKRRGGRIELEYYNRDDFENLILAIEAMGRQKGDI